MQQQSNTGDQSRQHQPHPNDRGVLVPAPEEDTMENIGVAQPGAEVQTGDTPRENDDDDTPQDRDGNTRRLDSPVVPPDNP